MSTAAGRIERDEAPSSLEIDPDGEYTLEALAEAENFNRWVYEIIAPHLRGPVLEVGSGIGNISQLLLEAGHETHLSDLRRRYCRRLEQALGEHPRCGGVLQLDIAHPDFDRACKHLFGRFSTVFALNVVEHVAEDGRAIANCRRLLAPGGCLIILVPAHPFLYNRMDRDLGHHRRYTRATLNALFTANGLAVVRSFYFNLVGALGWFVSGRLQGNRVIPRGQLRLYDRLVWLFRVVDRLTFRRLGLSIVTVGQVP